MVGTAFDTISSPAASTSTKFGGEATDHISKFLNGNATYTAEIFDSVFYLTDPADNTKRVRFDCVGITTGTDRVMTIPDKNLTLSSVIGTQEYWIPAQALKPRTTAGAALTDRVIATSNIELSTMNFDTTTQEYAQFPPIVLPANWNAGTVRYKVYWTCTGAGAGETIDFDFTARAFGNDDPLATALGGTQNITDTRVADDDVHITSYTAALTISGTPTDYDVLYQEMTRDVASDNLATDAEIIGVLVELTLDDGTSS